MSYLLTAVNAQNAAHPVYIASGTYGFSECLPWYIFWGFMAWAGTKAVMRRFGRKEAPPPPPPSAPLSPVDPSWYTPWGHLPDGRWASLAAEPSEPEPLDEVPVRPAIEAPMPPVDSLPSPDQREQRRVNGNGRQV